MWSNNKFCIIKLKATAKLLAMPKDLLNGSKKNIFNFHGITCLWVSSWGTPQL